MIKEKLGSVATAVPSINRCVVSGISRYEAALSYEIERLTLELRRLEVTLLPVALKDVEYGGSGLVHFVLRVGQFIPVCLAGIGGFLVRRDEQEDEVTTILNVWPTRTETAISIAVAERHEKYLNAYLAMQLNRSIGALEMVETWMVKGSDHWFIKPSVWSRIPAVRQQCILADILQPSNIGTPYALSIFDSLREEMLTLPDVASHPRTDRTREISKLANASRPLES